MTEKKSINLVLIVGMHRSGTSAVGHLLEGLGFDFGSNLLEGMRSVNDEGFWEDKEVVALNEHIFELFNTNWFDFERLPGKWWEDPRIKDLIGIAETWFYESFAQNKPIAIKDPRFCRLLPFWKRVFFGLNLSPHVVFVLRHPAEVAASLRKRDGFSLQVGYLLWLSYVIDGLYYARNLDLTMICYEDLLKDPVAIVTGIYQKDFSAFEPLPKVDIENVIKQVLHVDSRHQKAEQILLTNEIQDDVYTLAHEIYDVLRKASPEEAKSTADKYRKRLYRLLDHHKGVLGALQATVNRQVEVNKKLSEIGEGHSHALAVIHDKDRQLEENKHFIEKCLNEIGNKDSQLELTRQELDRNQARVQEQESILQKNNALWERFEELQQVVHGRELKLSESIAYIEKCEAWIEELNQVSIDCQRILAEQRDYIARCEARIKEQDQWLSENTAYIGKCEARIKEQDFGLAENQDYIQRCEARIREQDNGLQIRDQMLGERLDKINRHEMRIAELDEHLLQRQNELAAYQAENIRLNAEFTVKISELDKQLLEQKNQIATGQNYLRQCEEYIAEQDKALEEQSAESATRKSRIVELEAVIEAQRLELVELRNRAVIVNAEFEKKQTELSAYIAKCEARIVEQDIGIAENRGYIARCDARIKEQDCVLGDQISQIASLRDKFENAQVKVSELDISLQNKQKEIVEYQARMTEMENQVSELKINNGNLNSEADRLQKLDELNKQRMAIQKKQIDQLKTHAAALESELVALSAQNKSKHNEIERYRSYRLVRLLDKLTDVDKA